MLEEQIRQDFNKARLARDEQTKKALEAIISAITYLKTAPNHGKEVTDAEVINAVTKEIKTQNEVLDFAKGRDAEKTADAENRIAILTKYLPAQLSEDEVMELIAKADVYEDASPRTKGMIIKTVMPQIAGKFDKAKVNALVEKHLANK